MTETEKNLLHKAIKKSNKNTSDIATNTQDIATNTSQLSQIAQESILIDNVDKLNKDIFFPENVGLIAIRFDDNDLTVFTNAYPAMLARGLVGTLAIVANGTGTYPSHPKLTTANIIEMAKNGFEIANHSYSHLDTPTVDAWDLEVVQSKTKIETDTGYSIKNFVKPGTWSDDPVQNSGVGKFIMQTHEYYEGYQGGKYVPRPNTRRFGYNHDTGDSQTLVQLKEKVDLICGKSMSMEMLFHFVGYEGEGVSTADFVSFLDYIVEKRNAGLLINVPTIGIMAASIGASKNIIVNGDFSSLAANGYPVLFTATGTPTVESASPHSDGNAITCTTAAYLRRSQIVVSNKAAQSEIYRISVWHKTPSTGTARLIVLPKNDASQTVYTMTKTMVSTSEYQKLEFTLQIPTNTTSYFEVWMQPSVGTVTYADLQMNRIG